MRYKFGVVFVMVVLDFVVFMSATRAALTYSQSPDPYVAVEGTSGNIGFITLQNDNTGIASVTKIAFFAVIPTGGESDDKATNIALVAPNPTVINPLDIGQNGTANIKFTWDAVDEIKDNDTDWGDWRAAFSVDYHYFGQPGHLAGPERPFA